MIDDFVSGDYDPWAILLGFSDPLSFYQVEPLVLGTLKVVKERSRNSVTVLLR